MRYIIKTENPELATSVLIQHINECNNLEIKSVSSVQLLKYEEKTATFRITHLYPYLEHRLKDYLDEKYS